MCIETDHCPFSHKTQRDPVLVLKGVPKRLSSVLIAVFFISFHVEVESVLGFIGISLLNTILVPSEILIFTI